jgi:hypothetical protein
MAKKGKVHPCTDTEPLYRPYGKVHRCKALRLCTGHKVKCTVVQALMLCTGRTVKCTLVQTLRLCTGRTVKCTVVQALRLCTGPTAHRGSRGIALPFHGLGTRRGWGVSVTPQPLFTPGATRYPLYRRLGGPQGRSEQVRKISPSPGFDPRTVQPVAQSLYRLSYPANTLNVLTLKISAFFPQSVGIFWVPYDLPAKRNYFPYTITNSVGMLPHITTAVCWRWKGRR